MKWDVTANSLISPSSHAPLIKPAGITEYPSGFNGFSHQSRGYH